MYFGGFNLVFKTNGPVKFLGNAFGYPNICETKLGPSSYVLKFCIILFLPFSNCCSNVCVFYSCVGN